MTASEKARKIAHLKSEASAAKSKLMDILRDLERMEARRVARSLDVIIGRIEAWQNA